MRLQKGLLYVRKIDGELRNLFTPVMDVTDSDGPFRIFNLAVVRGTTEPSFDHATEFGVHGHRAKGHPYVEFKLATDQDLRALVSNWSERPSSHISEWFERIRSGEGQVNERAKQQILKLA